jgi:ABC-type hemin transport system ATPase subunit
MDQLGAISFGQALKKVNSVVIAVMGMTGSGKSTFIQKATGTSAAIVGDGLSSCRFNLLNFWLTLWSLTDLIYRYAKTAIL